MNNLNIEEWMSFWSENATLFFVKRLSANDTDRSQSHQVGVYLPKDAIFGAYSELHREDELNPKVKVKLRIDSYDHEREVVITWYNNKYHQNTDAKQPGEKRRKKKSRNEVRMTNLGGADSPLQNPDNAGSLVVFAFGSTIFGDAIRRFCHAWICGNLGEESYVEDAIGPVDPGKTVHWYSDSRAVARFDVSETVSRAASFPCNLSANEIEENWGLKFPSGLDIATMAIQAKPFPKNANVFQKKASGLSVLDKLLMARLDCEFGIFRSFEEAIELEAVKRGFISLEAFLSKAKTVVQRRKARAGRSLELHLKQIFLECGLVEGEHFSHQPESELGKKPDFLFPSESAYKNPSYPENQLTMLAAKTTCKDRWRQILNEADKIPNKHLFTLEYTISVKQINEMLDSRVILVIPEELHKKAKRQIQPYLMTLQQFILFVKNRSPF